MELDTTTLLHAALSEDNERALRFLLKHGADPDGRSPYVGDGSRPFQRLLGCDVPPVHPRGRSSSLVLRPATSTPAPNGGFATLQRDGSKRSSSSRFDSSSLDDRSTDYVPKTPRDPTALHVAAASGRADLAQLLLEAGAHVDPLTDGEYTPLALAVLGRRLEVARALLAAGASVEAASRRGRRPLHLAARSRRGPEVARLLLEHGADPNGRTRHGVAPLHVAAERGLARTVELLLDAGADPDARTDDGVTALHCAAVRGHGRVAEVLLSRGADVRVILHGGEIDVAPLVWGKQDERRKIAEVLDRHVAKVSPVGYLYGRIFKKMWKKFSGKNEGV